MTNPTPPGQVPEALRLADEISKAGAFPAYPRAPYEAAAAELRRLHAYCQELESHVILDCMTHVQNPAESEHVAGDVSKNGAELDTSQQPAPDYEAGWKDGYKHGAWSTQQPAPATQKLTEQICISDSNQSAACAVGNVGTTSDAQTTRSTHDAPATQQAGEVVAYLDVGANGYLDLGSELSEDALQQLPKGRHDLVIAGTYGIDGYVASPQPSPTAQADSRPTPVEELDDDACRCEPSDYVRPADYDGDGSVAAMARRAARAPADSVLEDADRYRWLFGARTDAQTMSVSETVFKPLPQDAVLSHLQGFYMSKTVVDALVDKARKQGGHK